MTSSEEILLELVSGQASTSVLAGKLRQPQPPRVIAAFCEDLELVGLIERTTIIADVVAWHLTDTGREAADKLKPAAA